MPGCQATGRFNDCFVSIFIGTLLCVLLLSDVSINQNYIRMPRILSIINTEQLNTTVAAFGISHKISGIKGLACFDEIVTHITKYIEVSMPTHTNDTKQLMSVQLEIGVSISSSGTCKIGDGKRVEKIVQFRIEFISDRELKWSKINFAIQKKARETTRCVIFHFCHCFFLPFCFIIFICYNFFWYFKHYNQ